MSPELFRILLIEDNVADVYLFQKALEGAEVNFELTIIADGAEAMAFVRRDWECSGIPVPNLALLDLNLPKIDGIELLQAIRQSKHLCNMPVVITSSSASPRERVQVERLGVERYIKKPPRLDDFLKIGPVLKEILLESTTCRPPAGAP